MRCSAKDCNKRIPKSMKMLHKCNCGGYYCNEHKGFSNHNCEINYFEKNKKCLERTLEKIETPKLVKC